MIIGIGTDIVVVERIGWMIDRFGARFLDRVFTADEQVQAARRGHLVSFYALRFAAKEAGWKALSPPRGRGIGWHDFEISATSEGQPRLAFWGKAAEVLAEKGGDGAKIDLSLSDDGGFALAFVVLSAS